jgi:hypothetical protein
MNAEILEILIEYIDAAIEDKVDDGESADGGLTSFIHKNEILEELKSLVSKECGQIDKI